MKDSGGFLSEEPRSRWLFFFFFCLFVIRLLPKRDGNNCNSSVRLGCVLFLAPFFFLLSGFFFEQKEKKAEWEAATEVDKVTQHINVTAKVTI